MFRTLITNQIPAAHLHPLEGVSEVVHGPPGEATMPRSEVLALAPSLDAIICQAELRVDAELLDVAPRLRIVANISIGVDNLDLPLLERRGVWATNVPHAFTRSAADFTIGLLLAVARRMVEADTYVRSRNWPDDGFRPGSWDGMELGDKTMGIVGFGGIGREVAKRAEAFDMQVVMHDPNYPDDPRFRPLETLLSAADVVSLHVPLTPGTHHLLDAGRLRAMKPGAILLNVARGPVIDEDALVRRLQEGHLAGAGLDVFENEPAVHPALRDLPQVVLSPHIAGGTRESRETARLHAARNVAAALQGGHPFAPLNQPVREQ